MRERGLLGALCRQLVLPAGDVLTRQSVMRHLRLYEEAQYWPKERVRAWQDEKLRTVVRIAYEETQFYRQLYDAAGVKPADIQTTDDLPKLPTVSKNMLRAAYPSGCTRASITRFTELFTSGSTGMPFAVRVDSESLSAARALMFLRAQFSGWRIGDAHLQTGMTLERGAVRYVKDLALRCEYVSAFDLSDRVIDDYLQRIMDKGIEYIMGYAASLYLMAERAARRGLNVRLKGAVSWGDNMFPAYRQRIESQFGCRVTDTYGCSEGIQMAAQCGAEHGGYHIFAPHVVVELVNGGQPVPTGEIGEVVLTRLTPGAMPFIRYEIGDLARASRLGECTCGRTWPMLQNVEGRSSNVVLTPRGNKLIVHFFTGIFEYARSISVFQVVQERLDSIVVRVVPKGQLDMAEWNKLLQQIAERGDPDLHVELQIVDDIPLERSNKRRFVVSRLKDSRPA